MDVHERLRRHPELVPVLEKLADETGKIREEARTLDEMEGRLVAMQRRLMPEVMKVLVEARGREAESAVESRANSKRYPKKLVRHPDKVSPLVAATFGGPSACGQQWYDWPLPPASARRRTFMRSAMGLRGSPIRSSGSLVARPE